MQAHNIDPEMVQKVQEKSEKRETDGGSGVNWKLAFMGAGSLIVVSCQLWAFTSAVLGPSSLSVLEKISQCYYYWSILERCSFLSPSKIGRNLRLCIWV